MRPSNCNSAGHELDILLHEISHLRLSVKCDAILIKGHAILDERKLN
jgi:hypothetical protein